MGILCLTDLKTSSGSTKRKKLDSSPRDSGNTSGGSFRVSSPPCLTRVFQDVFMPVMPVEKGLINRCFMLALFSIKLVVYSWENPPDL